MSSPTQLLWVILASWCGALTAYVATTESSFYTATFRSLILGIMREILVTEKEMGAVVEIVRKLPMYGDPKQLMEAPAYGLVEAARYTGVPYQTLRYWVIVNPLIVLASGSPPRLSFMNLMECHMLSSMRASYNVRIPKVRAALKELAQMHPHRHPLVDQKFETDDIDLFVREHGNVIVNLCRGGQLEFQQTIATHLRRIEMDATGIYRFFPFIEHRTDREPKSIMITPVISFGKPVIAGTGISTAVVASRFHARESLRDLAEEYGRPIGEIEEAIRWESRSLPT